MPRVVLAGELPKGLGWMPLAQVAGGSGVIWAVYGTKVQNNHCYQVMVGYHYTFHALPRILALHKLLTKPLLPLILSDTRTTCHFMQPPPLLSAYS